MKQRQVAPPHHGDPGSPTPKQCWKELDCLQPWQCHQYHGYARKDRKSLQGRKLRSALPLQSSPPSPLQWPDPFNQMLTFGGKFSRKVELPSIHQRNIDGTHLHNVRFERIRKANLPSGLRTVAYPNAVFESSLKGRPMPEAVGTATTRHNPCPES